MALSSDTEARVAAIVGGLLVIAGAAIAVPAAFAHASARSSWEEMSALVNDPRYDARRSDALYEEVLESLDGIQLGSRIGGPGFALWAVGFAALGVRRKDHPPSDAPRALRVLGATLVDGALAAGVLALAWLLAGSFSGRALSVAVPAVAPSIAAAILAWTLARGASPGMRLVGLSADRGGSPPRALRALVAALLTLPAAALLLVASPVVVPLALSRRRLASFIHAAHASLTGITLTSK